MAFAASHVRYDDSTVTRAPDLVRWGPVIAGVVIGLGFFALLNSLWLALAFSIGDGWLGGNLAWLVGATAAAALLLAGLVAGALAGVRGMLAGLANGVTAWSLVFLLSLTAIIPGVLNLTSLLGTGLQQGSTTIGGAAGPAGGGFTVETALWTSFWSLLAGLVLAALGGILGGRMRRPVMLPGSERRDGRDGPPPIVAEPGAVDGNDNPTTDALPTTRS